MTKHVPRGTSKTLGAAARRGKKVQLHQLAVARSDIAAALDSATLLRERVSVMSDPLAVPLFAAAVTAYARPFKRSKPHGKLPARWSKFGTPRSQKLHHDLLKARDTYIAHSDSEVRSVTIFPAGSSLRGFHAGRLTVAIYTTRWQVRTFPRIVEHCEDLLVRLSDETDRLLDELFEGVTGAPFPLDPEDGL